MPGKFEEYIDRYYRILEGRARKTLSEAEEDKILEEMDDLWQQMTAQEREIADEIVKYQECICTVGCDKCHGTPHVDVKLTPHGRVIHDKKETKNLNMPDNL